MVCIYCASPTCIVNSRPQKKLNRTWRRHECTSCHAVFTTEESVNLSTSVIVRHPHAPVQPFSRDKLFASILRAVGHRTSPIEDAGAITTTIIAKLVHGGAQASILPNLLIQLTLETLQNFDQAAAVQYRAYHRLLP